jgi:membrane protease YdiL (CAAX protease family)
MTLHNHPSGKASLLFQTALQILGAVLVFGLGTGAVFAVLLALKLGDAVMHDPVTRMWADLGLAAVLSGLFVLYAQKLGGVPARAFSFAFSAKDAAFALGAGALTLGLAAAYMLLLGRAGMHPVTVVMPPLGLLLIGFLGEFGVLHEEVLSRGFIFRRLQSRYPTLAALLVSAVLFSLTHILFKKVDFLLVSHFLVGIALGYMYLKSGSLLLTTAVHAFHNFAADLFLQGNNDGVSLGIGMFQFSARLSAPERLAFDVLLALATLAITYFVYGRGTKVWEPAERLRTVWGR